MLNIPFSSSSRLSHIFLLHSPKITKPSSFLKLSHNLSNPPTPPMSSSSSEQSSDQSQALSQVLKYHNQTKHSFNTYARGPHGLDWANQPNPFRRYAFTPPILLEHSTQATGPSPSYASLFIAQEPPQTVSVETLSRLFYDSLALSAWKTTGFSTWSLRVNPSSGNLHPTEAYVVCPGVESVHGGDQPFVAHYAPKEHALEVRSSFLSNGLFEMFRNDKNGTTCSSGKDVFFIGFSSIYWREAWKYGERAFRYCNHDVGHAIGAVVVAAAELGWDVKMVDGLGHDDLERLMGLRKGGEGLGKFEIPSRPVKGKLPEIEFESPECVLAVFPSGSCDGVEVDYEMLSGKILEVFREVNWKGKANELSKEHVCWDVIYRTAEVVKKPLSVGGRFKVEEFQGSDLISDGIYKGSLAREIVRKRRSAVDMDGVHVMKRETFYQMLLHCLPSGSSQERKVKQGKQLAFPFRALSWEAEVHAVLFVHRVEGLPKGLYFLVRNEDHFDELKKSTRSAFEWEKPEGCPDNLTLYRLSKGDCQQQSKRLSCHQDIASDGCFSLGMVARFDQALSENNVWMYPRLFWETGVFGHVLYLEAHAVGISATGIGCYFDDAVHEVLGLQESAFQSLYHFTVGSPIVDNRIMSLPAYPGPTVDG